VTVAYSATDALAHLENGERYDAILSDVTMPDLDGMAFFQRVLAVAPEQCEGFIFLTGGHVSSALARFLDEHRRPWVEKPFSPVQLKALINGRVRARTLPAPTV
jgi:CheY-like chemotaxis protein